MDKQVLKNQVGGDHYKKYPVQPIEYIMANRLDFAQGNIVKLATRFRDKGGATDLRKLKQYADFLLASEYPDAVRSTEPRRVPVAEPADGIYIVIGEGHAIRYTPDLELTEEEIHDCQGVAIKEGTRGLLVGLYEIGDTTLTARKDETDYDGYIKEPIDAVADWNGARNTEHLKAIGLADAIRLRDGWHIPSIGELYFIYTHRKELNAALGAIGAPDIAPDWYWSSTEHSAANAWILNLGDGYMPNNTKASGKLRVRPVSAFQI